MLTMVDQCRIVYEGVKLCTKVLRETLSKYANNGGSVQNCVRRCEGRHYLSMLTMADQCRIVYEGVKGYIILVCQQWWISVELCMKVLKETLSQYANIGESVFCTFLDETKSYDRVNYVKLFKLLVHSMLPPVNVQFLLNMYTSHVCRVSWNRVCLVPFSVLNGVKQG